MNTFIDKAERCVDLSKKAKHYGVNFLFVAAEATKFLNDFTEAEVVSSMAVRRLGVMDLLAEQAQVIESFIDRERHTLLVLDALLDTAQLMKPIHPNYILRLKAAAQHKYLLESPNDIS